MKIEVIGRWHRYTVSCPNCPELFHSIDERYLRDAIRIGNSHECPPKEG